MNSKKILTLSLSVLLSANLLASNKDADAEIGWRFGKFQDTNKTKRPPKTQKEILSEMLNVQKEQLKTQKEILLVLQKRFDPQPQTIMVNGKPCIANSSAKCYKWLPEPEAQRYPIIGKFYANPTIENAAEYSKWYSKHTNHALKAGVALYMAKYQYGDKVTDYNVNKSGTIGASGEGSEGKSNVLKKVFKENSDKFYINVFLGRSLESDAFGLVGIAALIEQMPEIKFNIIYYSDEVKQKLKGLSTIYDYVKKAIEGSEQSYVSPELFKKDGIYMTPTVEIVLKKTGESQIIGVGKISPTNFISKTLRYLWLKGIIKKNNYASDTVQWDNIKNLNNKSYETTGRVINFDKYQYSNTQMEPKNPEKIDNLSNLH